MYIVGGEWCGRPGNRVEWGAKLNILNKNLILCPQQILNYWAEYKGKTSKKL
jgi:hypothetical protein